MERISFYKTSLTMFHSISQQNGMKATGVQTLLQMAELSMVVQNCRDKSGATRRGLTYGHTEPTDAEVQAHQVQQHTDFGCEEEHLDVSEPELHGFQVFHCFEVVPDLKRDTRRALLNIPNHRYSSPGHLFVPLCVEALPPLVQITDNKGITERTFTSRIHFDSATDDAANKTHMTL